MPATTTRRKTAALAAVIGLVFASGVGAAAARGGAGAKPAGVAGQSPGGPAAGAESGQAESAAVPAPFTEALAFATKIGFRGVVTWSASAPVAATVRWGSAPDALTQSLVVPDAPDTAGVAVIDNLEIGKTYYVAIEDAVSGAVAGPLELVAANAYNDYDPATGTYDLNLLVQLDSQSLPADVPADQALADIGQGVNVFAERLYDALDGNARLGHVLVTDTQFAYAVNEPFAVEETVVATSNVNPCGADRNLADVLIQTSVPFDSHTFLWAIDEPCTSFYVGREGQLITPWTGDLHFGYVSTHEMLHYAFGAPDLYDPAAVNESGCKNADWDGSVMHNTGGWAGNQWVLTELDRSAEQTPCDHQHDPGYTWDTLQQRYTQIPDGPIEHMLDVLPRGNEDGGALDIRLLDRGPGTSTLRPFEPSDENPEYNPGTCSADLTSTEFPDPVGDATVLLGVDHGVGAASDPAVDIVGGGVSYSDVDGDGKTSAADTLTFTVKADDLQDLPATGGHGEFFEYSFLIGSSRYYVSGEWNRVGANVEAGTVGGRPVFELGRFAVTRELIATISGTWDVESDTVSIVVPAFIAGAGGGPALFQAPAGARISGISATSRRMVGPVIPDADVAGGGCAIRTPATAGAFPDPPSPPVVPTSPDAVLAGGERVTLAGRVWATNTGYSDCIDNLDDPRCNVFMVEVGGDGPGILEFDVASNAEPLEDYDVYLYDMDRAQLFFAAVAGPADAAAFPVDPGRYYVQVVPYDAPAGALFQLNLAWVA